MMGMGQPQTWTDEDGSERRKEEEGGWRWVVRYMTTVLCKNNNQMDILLTTKCNYLPNPEYIIKKLDIELCLIKELKT